MDQVSDRLLDQRLRNRIMEEVLTLAEGPDGVREAGLPDYFNNFFDWVPEDGSLWPNSTLTEEEREQLQAVRDILLKALGEAGDFDTAEAFIATGWPDRIAPVARRLLDTFLRRGRFGEDKEEAEPSSPISWP